MIDARTQRTQRTDEWLRGQGLPTLVPVSRWGLDLARRTAPLVVFVAVFRPVFAAVAWLYRRSPNGFSDLTDVGLLAVFVVAFVAIPAVLAVALRRWLDRMGHRAGQVAAWGTMLACLVLTGLTAELENSARHWYTDVSNGVVVIVAGLALVWVGGGSMLGWALGSTVRNLRAVSSMASIAVPVILGLVICAFFAADTWQLTDSLSWPRVFSVGLLIVLVASAVILPACRQAVRTARDELTDADRVDLVVGTPLADEPIPDEVESQHLSRAQSVNLLAVMISTQLLLGILFAALQAALLVGLGKVALTDQTLAGWLGHAPAGLALADVSVPISINLLKSSVFLAMISTLTFLISAVNDAEYRAQFFDPIITTVRQAMSVHDLSVATALPVERSGG